VFTGQSSDYSGYLELVADYIPNPLVDGMTDSILVKTYDGLNRRILDSSYHNLAPNNFIYTYGGPLLTIGRD